MYVYIYQNIWSKTVPLRAVLSHTSCIGIYKYNGHRNQQDFILPISRHKIILPLIHTLYFDFDWHTDTLTYWHTDTAGPRNPTYHENKLQQQGKY
jgi:hypothetical protein